MIIIDTYGSDLKTFPTDQFFIIYRPRLPDWSLNIDYEMQSAFANLIDYPPNKFFGSLDNYLDFFVTISPVISVGGLSPEAGTISSIDFDRILSRIPESRKEKIFKLLYVEDIRDCINFMQNTLLDIKIMAIEFYASLHKARLIADFPEKKEGIFITYGNDLPFVYLEGIFQKMFTALDFSVKLCKSIDFNPNDYTKYHKINAEPLQWSDRKKEKKFDFKILEDYEYLDELQSLRNDFTHNRSWEASRKIYYKTDKNGDILETWIYLHDHLNKQASSYVNRRRFYSQEIKINLLLPKMLEHFYSRIKMFIEHVYSVIN